MGLCVCSACMMTVSCHSPVCRDDPRKGSALIVSSTGCELKLEAQHIFAAIK